MSLLEMSFAGGVLILAVIVLRALTLNRLPKATFLALWAVAVLRLLVPFSIPSPASVYTLAERVPVQTAVSSAEVPAAAVPAAADMPFVPSAAPAAVESRTEVDVWLWVWLAGAAVCGAVFLISYFRCQREFLTALPVEDERLQAWLSERKLRRTVSLRQSDRVSVPVTYGIVRPVIILPNSTNWTDIYRLAYVLEHELTHIRHLDALWKLALAFTACVHWFNPLVWCMFVLANRDMELRCDEAVVRRLGLDRRSEYALTLISMEEKKSGLGPFASAFSKNAIEERIRAIMKIKKRSLAAVIAAAVLVCCVGVAFATSAAKNTAPYPWVEEGIFTKEELDRLASLWFEGYEDMTVSAYQQKMWTERDTPEDMELIERYRESYQLGGVFGDEDATQDRNAFYAYFYSVYEPLTAERWQSRIFPAVEGTRLEDGSIVFLGYTCTLHILDPDTLTVGEYRQVQADIKAGVKALMGPADPTEDDFAALSRRLSTDSLEVTVEALPTRSYAPAVDQETSAWVEIEGGYSYNDPDAELLAQFSREVTARWDETLAPYVPFGLTYQFDDPDYDGNGLTMWFDGKEVRGIYDEQKGVWITEHSGNGFSDGAVELYTVYTDGVLSGLREATPEEQAEFDDVRKYAPVNLASAEPRAVIEEREFPQSTMADYAAFRSLRTEDYLNLSLEEFNQRLLDWANENPNTWNRICCDVLWDDYPTELHDGLKLFAYLTCTLSGMENGQMVRALYTGEPEQDPSFSENMPGRLEIYEYAEGCVNAWCDLYYEISYHIADKSKVTVGERNNCFNYMRNAIYTFWQNTDMDALLQMTEEDIVEQFNIWAAEHSTENVTFYPVTVDDIHFEAYDERGID